jgi:hypothetical protein
VSEHDILRWAAKRAAEEPFLLAHDLREYRTLHDASEDDLASVLECSANALVCLALCRRPDPSAPSFRTDIEKIALHCGANGQKLAVVLREVDALRTIRQPLPAPVTYGQSGLLAAARDRERKPRRVKRARKRRGK